MRGVALVLSAIVLAAVSSAWADYPAEVLADGPLGYFKLNETVDNGDLVSSTSGDGAIYDSSTGSPVPAGQWWSHYGSGGLSSVAGILADDAAVDITILRSSGRTDRVPTGYPFTLEAWFRQYSVDRTGAIMAIGQTTATAGDTYAVLLKGGKLQLLARNGYTSLYATGSTPVDDDAWHHVVVVYEAEGNGTRATLYLDGEVAQPEAAATHASITYHATADNFTLGSQHYNNRVNTNQLADCKIDEVAVYDYALSTDRIAAHYAVGAPPAPVADAGADITLRAAPDNSPVAVTLDASASQPDDSPLAEFSWSCNGEVVATGQTATADFAVGTYTVVLTVTDAEGDHDSDTLVVTIIDGTPVPPVALAGADQAIEDVDGDGFETVSLDGTASHSPDVDGQLVSSVWTDAAGNALATTLTPTLTLARGVYALTLTVTDNYGLTASDVVGVAIGGEQLLNLPSDRPVFPVPADLVWPETVGDPHLCLWYGDKFAAMSITIDDNNRPQHEWWMEMGDRYGFTPTWYVVVGGVDAGSNPGFNGTWEDWRALDALGGDVQTHTMSHHSDDHLRTDEEVHYEYGQSQALINANVPGHQCLTIGYPYGNGKVELARQYFIAGRGVHGTPNTPGRIDWMMTSSVSGNISTDLVHPILYGTSGVSWLNTSSWKRSWLCEHFHTVQDTTATEAELAYIDSLDAMIWQGSFGEVARFGQERDSAEIAVTENTAARIAFTVTDRMNDLIFDHPLTIKLRIPDAWDGQATATQNGVAIACKLTTQGDYDYILVDAVPDRGEVSIVPATAPVPGDADGDGHVNIADFIILKQNYNTLSGMTVSEGDFNNDGAVNVSDFIILKQNYNR